MSARTTSSITLSILGVLALALIEVRFLAPTNVRAQNSQASTQTEKPFDQAQALADLRKAIAGQEDKPAGEVFKNIQMLKGMPAGRLLRVMEMGYARSLGVNCTHCHVAGQWEKEDKPTKQIARDMATMVANINNEQLKKIKNLKSADPVINCTTCHRGQTKPALNLPDSAPKQ
ncbi:MAG TPA: c-type cytochrome [Pyrinomonadaceae bacterium]|nr:c-type cytochrome [Pyrinomonadaceae bacterium]